MELEILSSFLGRIPVGRVRFVLHLLKARKGSQVEMVT